MPNIPRSRAICVLGVCALVLGPAQAQKPSNFPSSVPTLTLLNWGDYLDPALIAAFEKQEKVKVVQEVADGNAAFLKALKTAPGKYDVVFPSSDFVKVLTDQKLLERLDRPQLPNFKNLLPSFLGRSFDPKNTYSVPYLWGAVGFFYNSQTAKGPMDSWGALLDPKSTNRFVLMDSPRETFGAALKYAGESLNPKARGPLEAAQETLLKAVSKAQFRGFAKDVALRDKVLRGEADVAMVFVGDGIQGMAQDKRMRFALPKEGSLIFLDNMVIAAGAPQKRLAHRFINFMLEAGNAAQNATTLGYPTPNKAALERIPASLRDNPNIYPTAEEFEKLEFQLDAGKLSGAYLNLWNRLKVVKPKP